MDDFTYNAVTCAYRVITSVFFREIRTTGSHQVPENGPCIFIVAPHANQFIDPGLVLISNPRRFAPLMAEASFKRKIIGAGARLLKAIPVVRPQDLATKGKGTVRGTAGSTRIVGTDTQFLQQIRPRDLLNINKTIKLPVANVVSDTELELKEPLNDDEAAVLSSSSGVSFKVIPHVDQSSLYDKVHTRLAEDGCIVVFPEGGSHDRSEMLPLKAGFAIMALGAMAEHENLNVKIVPIGLNYFHPHRFRSRAVVSYGSPISIDRSLVEKYKQGGAAKREAISQLLKDGQNGLKSVTVNAPNYETLMVIAAARRLYKPVANNKLSLDQVVELNRRFLLGYKYFENDPRLKELERKVQAYNDTLKYFGLRDHQVARTDTNVFSATRVLFSRLLRLICFAMIGFPAILLNSPIIVLALIISRRKQAEALAGSSVKIAARDVLATWKVLVVAVFGPAIYGFYSCLLFGYLYKNTTYDLKACTLISLLSYIAQPFIHYIGVRSVETGMDIYKSLKPLLIAVIDPSAGAQLRAMRDRLSDDITTFVNENGPSALHDFDPNKYSRHQSRDDDSTSSTAAAADAQGLFAQAPNLVHNWLGDDHSLFAFGGVGHSLYDDDSSSSDSSSH